MNKLEIKAWQKGHDAGLQGFSSWHSYDIGSPQANAYAAGYAEGKATRETEQRNNQASAHMPDEPTRDTKIADKLNLPLFSKKTSQSFVD